MKNAIKNQTGSKVYQKVVFVIISCAVALGLAYAISKVAFDEMLNKVDKISTPNEKLKLVSSISRDILQIDQLQRSLVLSNKNYSGLAKESDLILQSLDTLKALYPSNTLQSKRIDSIRVLLNERESLFDSYIRVRKSLVDNEAFSDQIKNISSLIQKAPQNNKTTVTEKSTTKGTSQVKEEDNRGFFSKLLGIKSKTQKESPSAPEANHEELSAKTDTVDKKKADDQIDKAIQSLEVRQLQKSSTFISHETELTIAGGILVNKMFNILHEVEREAMQQMEAENVEAGNVVNQSVKRISIILFSFFVISVILVYLILSDIRKGTAYRVALENAKNEAEYYGAAKQRFLSNMSHELRTPLQSIIGYAEQLRHESNNSEKANVIYQSSEHLLQIVNEVLDYNRIISGKFNFHKEVIDLQKMANEVITVMNPQAERKGIALKLRSRISGSGFVLGDIFRLKQILFNLVGNAIKFTSAGEVLLEVTSTNYGENTDVNYRIQDTGQGIAEKDIDRIFNEFEQAAATEAKINFGNGLGLSIVKVLVEAMGGDIKIKSVLGKGSTFTVNLSLPSSDSEQIESNKSSSLQPVESFENTVWLIDDDAFILDLCHTILEKHHISHRYFLSSSEMLKQPLDPNLSHILTDMRMPEMNGKELYKRLRDKHGDEVKIIAFTAQALPEEREDILSLGFDGLLLKPFKEADLLEVLGLSSNGSTPISSIIEDDSDRIIHLFTKDTLEDLETLETSVSSSKLYDAELLAHRMAGRTAQLGGDKIAFVLRKMEIDIRNGDLPTIAQVKELSGNLHQFIQSLNKAKES